MNTYRIYTDYSFEEMYRQSEFLLESHYYLPQRSEVLTIVFVHLNFVLIFEYFYLLKTQHRLFFEMLPIYLSLCVHLIEMQPRN